MRTLALGLAAALMMSASGAYAADAKPAAATATTAAPAKTAKAEPTEKSKKCSAEADAKNLHGKPRKAFRKTCMKAA